MAAKLVCLAFVLFVLTVKGGLASEFGAREEAIAMVQRVQEKYKRDGAEETFRAVTDKSVEEFHDRDLYAFVYSLDGFCVAHGSRAVLVGKNFISLKDQDNKYLIKEMIDIANGPGSGWVNYKWPNPISNKIEDKASYIERMGPYFVGVGVYRF